MMSNAENGQALVARLLHALETPDEFTHEEAQALLPTFIEDELAGEDVESNPDYAALLVHLDQCDECIGLYEQLSEELEAAIGDDDPLPSKRFSPPSFFEPAPRSGNATLHILKGARPRFELGMKMPQFRPDLPLLGSEGTLFAAQLHELPGAPSVVVTIAAEQGAAELVVAIRHASTAARWQVQLIDGEQVYIATTDESGTVRFAGLAFEDLGELRLYCSQATD